MEFLSGIFGIKDARSGTAGSDASTFARVLGGGGGATGGMSMLQNRSKWDLQKAINNGFERDLTVMRCVDAIASSASKLRMFPAKVERVGAEPQEVDLPDLNRLLNKRANTYETSQQFRYRLSALLLLSVRGVFIEVVPSNGGGIAELHILPDSVKIRKPEFKAGTTVRANDVFLGVEGKDASGAEFTLDPYNPKERSNKRSVLWVRLKHHPTNLYEQVTPLLPLGLALESNYYARMFNRNFLANDGRPAMLINVRGKLHPEDAAELKRYFSGGAVNAGAVRVLEADDISVSDLTGSPRDAQHLETIRLSKEEIIAAFGLSETFLGNASGRTFDNADAENEITWMTTMVDHCNLFGSSLDLLTGDVDDDIMLATDFSTVDVLQRQLRRKHDKLMAELQQGVITIDDYREGTGRERLNIPGTRCLIVANVAMPQDLADIETLDKYPVLGQPNPESPEEAARRGATEGSVAGARAAETNLSARLLRIQGKSARRNRRRTTKALPPADRDQKEYVTVERVVPLEPEFKSAPYDRDRDRVEARIEGLLAAWTKRQERAVLARVSGPKAVKDTRHWVGDGSGLGNKALDARNIVNSQQWTTDLKDDIADTITPFAETHTRELLKLLARQGVDIEVENRFVVDSIVDDIARMVEEAAMRQTERISDSIAQMDASGKSMSEIKASVKDSMAKRNSWHRGLSTHATTIMFEGVQSKVYDAAGDDIEVIWNSEQDSDTRASHLAADGDERQGGGWIVGQSFLRFPGDPAGPINETAGCRCWTTWEVL